ncbi:hypothetical protein [Mycobacterium sp.]|uniref:hypothetical protein n=1 Tax=Mycobacterium sp. TaxID=1785 RepID=UPI003C778F8C
MASRWPASDLPRQRPKPTRALSTIGAPATATPPRPTPNYNWDWNICHTYYWTKSGQGNVPYLGHLPSNLWDGNNPPANSVPPCGTDMWTGTPGRC